MRRTRLGPCEIESVLGAGGMGDVYRARDTRLKRDVAIKVLPEVFAGDPDRVAGQVWQSPTTMSHTTVSACFIMIKDEAGAHRLKVVLNWFGEPTRRAR